jgi:hypothetical protein
MEPLPIKENEISLVRYALQFHKEKEKRRRSEGRASLLSSFTLFYVPTAAAAATTGTCDRGGDWREIGRPAEAATSGAARSGDPGSAGETAAEAGRAASGEGECDASIAATEESEAAEVELPASGFPNAKKKGVEEKDRKEKTGMCEMAEGYWREKK